jgi:hypothetical protein
LPQPDGPSSVKNSPLGIVSDTSSTARTAPKDRLTRSIAMLAKGAVLARARLAKAPQRVAWMVSFSFSSVSVRFAVQPSSS